MKRGRAVWMLYVPTLMSLWCSLGYDRLYLSPSYMFWLLTYHLSILVKLGSWSNEVWPKPEDFLFGPLIPGMLFSQQRYKGSLQPIAWVNSKILLDHLWFPGLSSVSSLHGKDLSEDTRIIGNQAVHKDLTRCLVWPHIRCLTPPDNMPSIPAFIRPPVPMGRLIYVLLGLLEASSLFWAEVISFIVSAHWS